jgi:hypothetical protein
MPNIEPTFDIDDLGAFHTLISRASRGVLMRRLSVVAIVLLVVTAGCGGEGAENVDAAQDRDKLELMYEQGQQARTWMQRHSPDPAKPMRVTEQQCGTWFDHTASKRISSDEGFRSLARYTYIQGCMNGGNPGDRRIKSN